MSKKTTLNENASIYQHRDNQTEKQKWNDMNKQEKRQYFKDYYRFPLIVCIVALVFIGYLVYSFVKPQEKTVLSIAVVNDYMEDTNVSDFRNQLSNYLQINTQKENISVDTAYYFKNAENGYMMQQKFFTYVYGGTIDIIIADEEQFETYVKQGYFMNLSEALPTDLYSNLTDEFYFSSTSDAPDDTQPFGISLKNSETYKQLKGYCENPVIGIVGNSNFKDNAVETIRFLFE